jgi:hypothetical protein
MKNIVGSTFFTLSFIVLIVSMAAAWIIYRTDQEDSKISQKDERITSIEADYDYTEGKIFLNVHGPALSCDDVYQILHIESITISERIYDPSCGKVSDGVVEIIYTLENKV